MSLGEVYKDLNYIFCEKNEKNCAHKSFYKFVKPSSISKLPMFIFYLYFFFACFMMVISINIFEFLLRHLGRSVL